MKIEKFLEFERGEIVGQEELAIMLESKEIVLLTFSCLSGEPNQLPKDLGKFFATGKHKLVDKLIAELTPHMKTTLRVIVDDTDPVRIWGSQLPQSDITEWLRMLAEDFSPSLPNHTNVTLWSDIEKRGKESFEETLNKIRRPEHALLVHHRQQHMRRRPPRRLFGNIKEASERRVAQFVLQGSLLESIEPRGVLVQTDTPWAVKDPPYQALRKKLLPIIHPFPEIQ